LTDLAAMNSDISSAQSISSSIEQSVVPLQPTDYDTNHSVLSGMPLSSKPLMPITLLPTIKLKQLSTVGKLKIT